MASPRFASDQGQTGEVKVSRKRYPGCCWTEERHIRREEGGEG